MRRLDISMLRIEGTELPYPEGARGPEQFAEMIGHCVTSFPEDTTHLKAAEFACQFTDSILNVDEQCTDPEQVAQEAEELAKSDVIKNQVLDLMQEYPNLTPAEVAEHVFVWRYLRYIVKK